MSNDLDGAGPAEALVRTDMSEKDNVWGDELFEPSPWDMGEYVGMYCPNCGRQRVCLCENKKRRCDKCNWVVEDGEYCVESL